MIKPVFILIFSISTLIAYGQSRLGFQIEMGLSTLTQISSDTIVPYGYSGAESSVEVKFYASPTIRFRHSLGSKFSLEVGLGYLEQDQEIRLQHYHPFFHIYSDTTLNINLKYISIPIAINYAISTGAKSSFLIGATINTNVLISQEDNFEDLIYEEIGFVNRNWYTRFVLSPSLSLAYQIELKDDATTEIGLFVNKDVTALVNKNEVWGYYENLVPARSLRYGVQAKYLFKL